MRGNFFILNVLFGHRSKSYRVFSIYIVIILFLNIIKILFFQAFFGPFFMNLDLLMLH